MGSNYDLTRPVPISRTGCTAGSSWPLPVAGVVLLCRCGVLVNALDAYGLAAFYPHLDEDGVEARQVYGHLET